MKSNCLKSVLMYFALLLCITIFALSTCKSANAQTCSLTDKRSDAISMAYQPVDAGLGLRYDHSFYTNRFNECTQRTVGFYTSISYGNYWLNNNSYIKDHTKFTLGVLIPVSNYLGYKYDFTAGINYHNWYNVYINGFEVNPKIFNPWSFELGITVKAKWFMLGMRTDILRWEPCVDVGYVFKYRKL